MKINEQNSLLIRYFIFIILLFWSETLFMSPFYLLFLFFSTGIFSQMMLKKTGTFFKILIPAVLNSAFAYFYLNLTRLHELSNAYICDIFLFHNAKINIIQNLSYFKYLPVLSAILGILGYFAAKTISKYLGGKTISFIFITVLVLNFNTEIFKLNISAFQDIDKPPKPLSYSFDGHHYLRTFYLMKAGNSFYESINTSLTQRKGDFKVTSVYNIRPPLLFLIWKFLAPDGIFILALYIILSSMLFFISYVVIFNETNDPIVSVLTPVLLSGVFIYAACANWFMFPEYWAWLFLTVSILAGQKKSGIIQIMSFSICLMIRELFIFVFFIFFLSALIEKNRIQIRNYIVIFIITALYYISHYTIASCYVDSGSHLPLSISNWLNGSLFFAEHCLLFGSTLIIKPHLFFSLIILLYVTSVIRIIRDKKNMLYPLAAIPLFGFSYLIIGYNEVLYWGLLYIPSFAFLVPVALCGSDPQKDPVDSGAERQALLQQSQFTEQRTMQ